MEKNVSTRRIFLQKGLTLLAVAQTIPTFLDQTVLALNNPLDSSRTQQPTGKDGKILVVVQLSGGNDGLSMVIPYGDDAYYQLRNKIAHPASQVLKIDNYIGLHPNLTGLKSLYDNGDMAIVQGVGYPNPNRSHFRAMDIWQSAQPERQQPNSGWLGRYFDNTCPGCDPRVGVAIGEQLPLAMEGDKVLPLSFERPDSYRYNGRDKADYAKLNHADLAPTLPPPPKQLTAADQLDFLHRTAMDAQLSSEEILRLTRTHSSSGTYPATEFGNGLKTVAAMIAGGLPTRVYYVSLTGFDTHAAQLPRHDALMKQLSEGLSAFWQDLKQQKNDDRVLLMTFSEFGRRVQQNASNGTDHGAAAPMFVMGPGIRQGIVTNHPSMSNLDQGDLKYVVDFRSVYASVLQNWLETPSKPILGDQFPLLPLVKV
ncbi:MAG TPA: DUF1501 domain-containing protein [Tepidisphaeraceae bacterium]|jgi:uncharacterized protein (DUF1501 family)|nr:DUF1501 domain-containing protein [Tepidisphaeraceae bacterium]